MQVNNRDSGKGDYNPTVVRSFDLKMKTFRKNFGTQRSRQSEQNASKSNDIYDPCDREHGIPLYNPERHLRSKPSVAEQAFNYGTKGIIIGGAVAGGVLSAYLMPVSAIPIAQGAADMAY